MNTKEKTLQYLQCLGARDLNKILTFFNEKVDWDIPGDKENVPWLGRRNTLAEVKEFYELLWGQTEALGAEIHFIGAEGNLGIVTGTFQTRIPATSKIIDSLFFLEIEFNGEFIAKYRLLEDTLQVSLALTK